MNVEVGDMMQAMKAAGCSADQIVAAVQFISDKRADNRREQTAKRTRSWRARVTLQKRHGDASNASQASQASHQTKSMPYEENSDASNASPRARVEDNLLPLEDTGKNSKGKNNISPRDVLIEGLRPEVADAVLAHRRAKKCPLTTAHAARLLLKSFNSTADPNGAAETMIARGWQGFNAEWLDNSGGKGNGRGQKGDLIEAGLELVEKRRREAMQPDSRGGNVDAVVRLLSER